MPASLQTGIAAIRASQQVLQASQKATGFSYLIGTVRPPDIFIADSMSISLKIASWVNECCNCEVVK